MLQSDDKREKSGKSCVCKEIQVALNSLPHTDVVRSPSSPSFADSVLESLRRVFPALKAHCLQLKASSTCLSSSSSTTKPKAQRSQSVMQAQTFSEDEVMAAVFPLLSSGLVRLREESMPTKELNCHSSFSSSDQRTLKGIWAQARREWENSLSDEIHSIAAESRRPFSLLRGEGEKNNYLTTPHYRQTSSALNDTKTNAHTSSSNSDDDDDDDVVIASEKEEVEAVRFLYDSDDLCAAIVAVMDKNSSPSSRPVIPPIAELFSTFKPLLFNNRSSSSKGSNSGKGISPRSRQEEDEAVLRFGSCLDVRKHLQRGGTPISSSLRGKLWWKALCLCSANEGNYDGEGRAVYSCPELRGAYEVLVKEAHRIDLLADEMVVNDVRATAEEPDYFVFEVSQL